jgi:hypothetical protein
MHFFLFVNSGQKISELWFLKNIHMQILAPKTIKAEPLYKKIFAGFSFIIIVQMFFFL